MHSVPTESNESCCEDHASVDQITASTTSSTNNPDVNNSSNLSGVDKKQSKDVSALSAIGKRKRCKCCGAKQSKSAAKSEHELDMMMGGEDNGQDRVPKLPEVNRSLKDIMEANDDSPQDSPSTSSQTNQPRVSRKYAMMRQRLRTILLSRGNNKTDKESPSSKTTVPVTAPRSSCSHGPGDSEKSVAGNPKCGHGQENFVPLQHTCSSHGNGKSDSVSLSSSRSGGSVSSGNQGSLCKSHAAQSLRRRDSNGVNVNTVVRKSGDDSSCRRSSSGSTSTRKRYENVDVEKLVDFIEGKSESCPVPIAETEDSIEKKSVKKDIEICEKKRNKKERQKQERLERLRKEEEEKERIKKMEEEARLAEEKRQVEAERAEYMRQKKAAKKEAQRSKKNVNNTMGDDAGQQSSKVVLPISSSNVPPLSTVNNLVSTATNFNSRLDELIAIQQRELEELQRLHRQQFDERVQLLKQEVLSSDPSLLSVRPSATTGAIISGQRSVNSQRLSNPPVNLPTKGGRANHNVHSTVNEVPSECNSKKSRKNRKRNKKEERVNSTEISRTKINGSEAVPSVKKDIKIRRTPSGRVEFIEVDRVEQKSTGVLAPPSLKSHDNHTTNSCKQSSSISQYPTSRMSANTAQETQLANGLSTPTDIKEQQSNNGPMVTIRRVTNPRNAEQPTVTISLRGDGSGGDSRGTTKEGTTCSNTPISDKLLYTLVNGKIVKAATTEDDNVGENLLGGLSGSGGLSGLESFQASKSLSGINKFPSSSSTVSGGLRKCSNLPLDSDGRVDLDRLDLPPGISISKISPVDQQQQRYGVAPTPPSMGTSSTSPTGGMVSTLEHQMANLNVTPPSSSAKIRGGVSSPVANHHANDGLQSSHSSHHGSVKTGVATASDNKQVLIRNVNGKAVILPVPSPPFEPPSVGGESQQPRQGSRLSSSTNSTNSSSGIKGGVGSSKKLDRTKRCKDDSGLASNNSSTTSSNVEPSSKSTHVGVDHMDELNRIFCSSKYSSNSCQSVASLTNLSNMDESLNSLKHCCAHHHHPHHRHSSGGLVSN